ncbi:hypothetical protein LINPERPRIM_LOCUS12852 [Linum perenne]
MEILHFRELLSQDWDLQIEHTYREGNRATDFLDGTGYDYPFESHTFDISDCRLGYFLRHDCFGIAQAHMITVNDAFPHKDKR